MTSEEQAIEFVLRHEGGYKRAEPSDPGGETNFGISRRAHPDENIKGMTRERASQIYYTEYWLPIRGDALPVEIALPLMDFAVHSSVERAVQGLQRIVGAKVDKIMGRKTIDACREAVEKRGVVAVAEDLILDRGILLVTLGCKRHGSDKDLVGWMKRIRDNLRFVRSG